MYKIMLILLLSCISVLVYAQDNSGNNNGYQSGSYGATPYSSSSSGSTNSYDSSSQTLPTNRTQNDTTSGSDMNGNNWISPEPPATPAGTSSNSTGDNN